MSALIKPDPKQYGIEPGKAHQISALFKPMLDTMVELEEEAEEIAKLEISPDVCKMAKSLRLRCVKVRTGTAKIHKEQKSFYLQAGRFIDGWKNTQLMAGQGLEEKLMAIEKHYENIEKARIAELEEDRQNKLSQYGVEVFPSGLGEMEESVWENFLTGAKVSHEAKIEAEKKAEADRIAKEKAEAEERERIRLENERLKAEAEERKKAEAARLLKEKKEREAREKKEAAVRAAEAKKLEAERKEKEKLAAELQAKKEAEEKAEAERLAKIEAELNKGDADKVKDLISDLRELKTKYTFKSKKNQKMYSDVGVLLSKIIDHIG